MVPRILVRREETIRSLSEGTGRPIEAFMNAKSKEGHTLNSSMGQTTS